MINALRKHQQVLMIVITILVIIAFVWLYNGTATVDTTSNLAVGRIYGRPVSVDEFQRDEKKFYLCMELGLFELVQSLAGMSQRDGTENFIWNSRILKHEARELQVEPTDQEVVARLKELRPFQTDDTFDPQKYALFIERSISPRGFTESQLEELVRDDLRAQKVKKLLGATFETSPAEFRQAYERQFQKMQVSLVRLKRDEFLPKSEPTDEEIAKAFEQTKESLTTEEQRRISVASFLLAEGEKGLKGRERIEVLQKLADRANDLTQAMLENKAGFAENASRFGATVAQAAAFTRSNPDAQFATVPEVPAKAFTLSQEDPNSDVVQSADGFYVLHLEEIIPARPLTADEARPKIIERIKADRSSEAMNLKAAELRNTITAELKAGKSFTEAVATTGQKAETFPPFSLSERNVEAPDSREVMAAAPELKEGELSSFVPTAEGGLLVHLDRREPLDEVKFEKDKATMLEGFNQSKQEIVFQEWLRLRRAAAKLETGLKS